MRCRERAPTCCEGGNAHSDHVYPLAPTRSSGPRARRRRVRESINEEQAAICARFLERSRADKFEPRRPKQCRIFVSLVGLQIASSSLYFFRHPVLLSLSHISGSRVEHRFCREESPTRQSPIAIYRYDSTCRIARQFPLLCFLSLSLCLLVFLIISLHVRPYIPA